MVEERRDFMVSMLSSIPSILVVRMESLLESSERMSDSAIDNVLGLGANVAEPGGLAHTL